MLDNIESNLAEANDYLEKAEANLEAAQDIHKANRSKMMWILLVLVLVFVPIVLWLLGII